MASKTKLLSLKQKASEKVVRPDYVPEKDWNELSADERTELLAMDPEEAAALFVASENGDDDTDETDTDETGDAADKLSAIAISTPLGRLAVDMANKIDDRFQVAISEAIDAAEKAKSAPIAALYHLERAFTKDELAAMPYPGTTDKMVAGTNRRAAKYNIMGRNADGEPKAFPRDYWVDLFNATPMGKEYRKQVAHWQAQKKSDAISSQTKAFAVAKTRYWENRITIGRGVVMRAYKVHDQMDKVRGMPLVGVEFVRERDKAGKQLDEIMNTPKPIKLWNKAAAEDVTPVSITSFLSYDVQEAIEKGGTVEALTATTKREKKTGTEIPAITNVDQSGTFMFRLHTYYDNGTDEGTKHLAALDKALGTQPKNEALLLNWGRFLLAMDGLWTKHNATYQKVEGTIEKDEEAAA